MKKTGVVCKFTSDLKKIDKFHDSLNFASDLKKIYDDLDSNIFTSGIRDARHQLRKAPIKLRRGDRGIVD